MDFNSELKRIGRELDKVFKTAGDGCDLSKVNVIDGEDVSGQTTGYKTKKISDLNDRLAFLGEQIRSQGASVGPSDFSGIEGKGLGGLVAEDPGFREFVKNGAQGTYSKSFDKLFPSDVLGTKTLFQTSAGWDPQSLRQPGVVEKETRPIQVLDILPTRPTSQAKVVYMLESTRTHSAAETSEGTAFPESAFVLTETSTDVRKIADSIPVTDELLADVAGSAGFLNDRLIYGLRQRLDNQIVQGDGAAPNLEGILNATGIQTQVKGGDPTPDAIFKAAQKIRVTGRAQPTHVLIHPNDWQAIRLVTTADGIYLYGDPSKPGTNTLFGLTVVQSDILTENTALVGSFMAPWIVLWERAGVEVTVGYVGTQFTEGEVTLRATGRFALQIGRPAAMCTVTGI